jgi:hypothetical protein
MDGEAIESEVVNGLQAKLIFNSWVEDSKLSNVKMLGMKNNRWVFLPKSAIRLLDVMY